MKTFSILIALGMLLAGCARFPQVQVQNTDYGYYWMKPEQAQAGSKAGALLYYADYVRHLGAADFAQEVEHARLLYTQEKSDFHLLQYALALLVPDGDARKAQQLIEPLLNGNNNTDPELGALAKLLNSVLAENQATRRRLETETRRAEEEAKRAEEEARRAEAGVKRADELQKQLEAIKNIEKNMIERDKTTGVKR